MICYSCLQEYFQHFPQVFFFFFLCLIWLFYIQPIILPDTAKCGFHCTHYTSVITSHPPRHHCRKFLKIATSHFMFRSRCFGKHFKLNEKQTTINIWLHKMKQRKLSVLRYLIYLGCMKMGEIGYGLIVLQIGNEEPWSNMYPCP